LNKEERQKNRPRTKESKKLNRREKSRKREKPLSLPLFSKNKLNKENKDRITNWLKN
jgi:hypothetical protein